MALECARDVQRRSAEVHPASRGYVIRTLEGSVLGKLMKKLDKKEETVLLVDDEEMVIEASRDMLQALGYEVLVARDGNAAVRLCEENRERIGLTILDVIMPGMSGRDTYDKLKQIKPEMKIILSSGYPLEYLTERTEVPGHDAFLEKPFGIEALSEKLREIMD